MISKNKGFTLIELLVVISIIGALIALSIFALESARKTARDSKRKSDLETIRSGLEIYKSDCGTYLSILPAVGSSLTGTATCSPASVVYIQSVPGDSIAGRNYSYVTISPYSTYKLCAALEQTSSVTYDVSGCGCGTTCTYSVKNP